nr:DNA polymerase Y family protein [Altericroceibacterium xinjiangense]
MRRSEDSRGKASPERPLVTVERAESRMQVASACPLAQAQGVHPGMALARARLIADLDIRPADPEADRHALTRLALMAARRWTPRAGLSGPDGLWLDLAGSAHLFGGEQAFCDRVVRFCARIGLTARIAVAGTYGAAHALARHGAAPVILCPNGRETERIAPLPLDALRLDSAMLGTAHRFGIERVGDLFAMPRAPLQRRLGRGALIRLDQALGRVEEPFDPVLPEERPFIRLNLVEPISTPEAIRTVIGDLVTGLARQLLERGCGARKLMLTCSRVDGEDQRVSIALARASRDPAHLLRLVTMKVEEIEPGWGIEAMAMTAVRIEPLAPEAVAGALSGTDPVADLAVLIDRLATRLGSSCLSKSCAVQSDVPERSVRSVTPLEEVADWPSDWPRPVWLLSPPEPVDQVLASLPDRPPARFRWRGRTHIITHADGPERIYGEWWKRPSEKHRARDYFQVEDKDGARFWLFRRGDGVDPASGDLSWYIHGVFG